MKRCILATALLGSTGTVSAAEYPSLVMDTWCTTYLSTYLVPIAAPPDILPSKHLTFFGNSSTAIASSTRDQTFIAPESRTTAIVDFSTDAAPTEAKTDSEARSTIIVTGSLTEPIDTSSTLPTSTSIVEPPGRAVIFLIQQTVNNENRNIKKRATEGFVGGNNPDICTFALTFNLAEGQLFVGGSPTFYAGEDFKPLGFQGDDSLPQGAVTRTFATSGRTLVFQNSALPNGEAGFCQDVSGETYITFTSSPPGCIPVTLGVYDVEQCQNGQLVGVEASFSSLAVSSEPTTIGTATFGSVSSDEPTIAATTVSTEVISFSSIDRSNTPAENVSKIFTTASSESVDSSFTTQSAIPTGDSSTEAASSSEPNSPTRTSESSTAPHRSTTESSSEPASSVSSGTFFTTEAIIPTSTTTVSESQLESTESTTEITTSLTIEASVTSQPIETSTSLPSTSEESTSETSTADVTTLPVSTTTTGTSQEIKKAIIPDTTTDFMTTTTTAALTQCNSLGTPYTSNGVTFDLSCNTGISPGTSVGTAPSNSFDQCIGFCVAFNSCVAVSYVRDTGSCTGYSSVGGTVADNALDIAIKR
ncbi:hypothetical protein NW768_012167 [Fusarium equiseti]|uniref:DUF7908 domain-containing protein n=1 Tax=Fusarium equiseti TaxID=61235 RepID=A0ABQ8QVJ9_FUSEQ|nr:hypothetical protein NW768_012167 [Fusarium equiseti]